MTLLHQYLSEIAIGVDVADLSLGPTKIPAPGDIIQFLAIKEDGNLRILYGAKSEPMVAFTSLHELSYPRLNVKTVGAAINIVTGRHNQLAFFSDLPFREKLIVGLLMTGFQRDLQIFFYQSFLIVLLVSFGLYSFGQWLLWRFLSQPLHALVETINSFSTDPTIAKPLPPNVTQSREFDKAAKVVEQIFLT